MIKGFQIVDRNVLFDNNAVYKIAYSITIADKEVFYMVNIDDYSDLKFCYKVSSDEYEEILDREELKIIVKELSKCVNTFIR